MKYRDYYQRLGVARDASDADIAKAYRKLAHRYHPDVSKEPDAEEQFKEVAEAYKTLKDPEKRAAYDQLGQHKPGDEIHPPPGWQQEYGQAPFATDEIDLSELFAGLRAGGHRPGGGARTMRMPGPDYELPVQLSLEDAYRGTEVELGVQMPEYDDRGVLRSVPQKIRARIPKGATDGQRLRLPGKGGKGFGGGRPGDLYLNISLRPHPRFRASGHDLYLDLPLAPWEAVLGTTLEVPTLGGVVRLKIAPGTVAGRQLRLTKRGLPKPHGDAGELYAIVQIVVPAICSDEERALYEQLARLSPFNPRAQSTTESGHDS